jgi:hypothetical protein
LAVPVHGVLHLISSAKAFAPGFEKSRSQSWPSQFGLQYFAGGSR